MSDHDPQPAAAAQAGQGAPRLTEHRVLIGQHATSSWFADCADCAWIYECTSPAITQNAAGQHGEIMPGGYMPTAFVEALVLGVMSPPDHPWIPLSGSQDADGRYTRCGFDGCEYSQADHQGDGSSQP